ncbi:hypothetical protein B5M42_019150 [Paenibacillus athensensis]|uniref:Uncharacterized protein n=1 Tax=Paenibacillus athensensis TaxID=1967502 RepID=A0A4Y8Q5I1_9BACL|nr:hypothetical protein [Paenibacillus athensensis]MCD1260924.1 hypothetical protein [Paenibacillus athensensis]
MKKQTSLLVILLSTLLIAGCESAQTGTDAQTTPQQSVQPSPSSEVKASPVVTAPITTVKPAVTAAAGKVEASPELVEGTANKYSLDEIERILHEDKTVFDIVESPNRRAIAYMVSPTRSEYDEMTLYIWNVGEEKPRSSQAGPDSTVGEVFWSPNSDYVFVDVGTFVTRGGGLYSAKTLEVVQAFGYLNRVYFSPDGKHIVYSGSSDRSIDTLKGNYLDPGEAFDLVVYDIDKHQESILLKGTKTEDFIANGWLDSNTISYHTTTYHVVDDQIHDVDTKYTYELDSQASKADPTQKRPTTDADWDRVRSLLKKSFSETWSPDRQTLAFVQGIEKESYGSVWFWRLNEDQPVQVSEDQMLGQIVWSNNSRYFMFNSGMSSEDEVHVVDIGTGKAISIGCFCMNNQGRHTELPYFSADSRYVLFSGIEDIRSTYKSNTETGNSHNVSLLNLTTGEVKVVFPADEKRDYIPLGWSGEKKMIYRIVDYAANTRELAEYELSE